MQRLFSVILILVWTSQAVYLLDLESQAFGWWILPAHAALIAVGIVGGVLLFRRNSFGRILTIGASVGFLVLIEFWRWIDVGLSAGWRVVADIAEGAPWVFYLNYALPVILIGISAALMLTKSTLTEDGVTHSDT